MIGLEQSIPEKPNNPYDPEAANGVIACARSYLEHADRLIYSYGSRTFLSGFDLFDPAFEDRGNIDCSTFVLLVLSGISYEESPYVTGRIEAPSGKRPFWADPELIDFSAIPKTHIDIAEKIGRPYLKGPKGLDLKKAEELGISIQDLADEILACGIVRKSVAIAQYYFEREACFSDIAYVKPGDIVFFRTKGFFKEGDRKYKAEAQINHVGFVAEDTSMMIHSSGSYKKGEDAAGNQAAVAYEAMIGKRTPAFFARPKYRK